MNDPVAVMSYGKSSTSSSSNDSGSYTLEKKPKKKVKIRESRYDFRDLLDEKWHKNLGRSMTYKKEKHPLGRYGLEFFEIFKPRHRAI